MIAETALLSIALTHDEENVLLKRNGGIFENDQKAECGLKIIGLRCSSTLHRSEIWDDASSLYLLSTLHCIYDERSAVSLMTEILSAIPTGVQFHRMAFYHCFGSPSDESNLNIEKNTVIFDIVMRPVSSFTSTGE